MTTMHVLETTGAEIVYDVHGPLPTPDGRPPLLMIGQPMGASGFASLGSHFSDRTVFFLIFAVDPARQGVLAARRGPDHLAFSVGSFVLAAVAVPLAQRYGRLVLSAGGVLLAAGSPGGSSPPLSRLGGALGVAVIGTVFFSRLEDHTFTDAFTSSLPVAATLFLAAAVLALMLPRNAVTGEAADFAA